MITIKITFIALAAFFITPYVLPAPSVAILDKVWIASDLIEPQPNYRFTTDGCSGGLSIAWRIIFRGPPSFEHCCIYHDFSYWRGGTVDERSDADAELWRCVAQTDHAGWAWVMWLGVRPGGVPWLPTAWRWGYGWRFPRGYE